MYKFYPVQFTQEYIQLKDIDLHLMHFEKYDPIDYLDQLTDVEKERFFSFKHQNRKCEFVATRILRHRLFGFQHIHYDLFGAPYIEDEGFISISHSPGVVGIALCKNFKIGLDLEKRRDKALYLCSKFLSDEESQKLNIASADEMTKVWSGKEVLYKLAGRKQLLFKHDLLLSKVDDQIWKGTIINPTEIIKVDLSIFVQNDLIISISTSACQFEKRTY